MKTKSIVLLCFILLTACAPEKKKGEDDKPNCVNSNLNHVWTKDDGSHWYRFTLNKHCVFNMSHCDSKAKFDFNTVHNTLDVTVIESDADPSCVQPGVHNCTYATDGVELNLSACTDPDLNGRYK